MHCVEQYSTCALTNPSDKQVALSGVARLIHEQLGQEDTYLAGLWKSRLVGHLLWATSSESEVRRAKLYRAPTWSWACLDTDAAFSDDIFLKRQERGAVLVTVLEANTTLIDGPFGQVSSGTVRTQGPFQG
jgi:hypothetical protein